MSESKCPFHGSTTTPNLGTQNKDWWPNHLNLDILRQHSNRSNPIAEINYKDDVKQLDLKAVKNDIKKTLKGFKGEIIFPEHHLSHAAHTFYTSPFEETAILTVDGVGEWSTTSFGFAKNNSITLTNDIRWPHSLGLFYSAFTYFLGFQVNEGEYKLMGLASFGKPKYYDLIWDNLIDVKNDGSIHLNMDYFAFTYDRVMTKQKFSELFGIKRRNEDEEMKQIHYDLNF